MPEYETPARRFASRVQARASGEQTWYRIKNLADDAAEVAIFDEIGYWGVSAADFVRDLSAIDATRIDLLLSSPGGDLYDGIAIHNALRSHRARVTVHVQALAASIASVIAMAGDRIVMAPYSQLMIHDAMTVAVGNAAELREVADFVDRQSDNLAGIYAERAGGTAKQWRKAMLAETWYSAKEAVAAGLADEVAKPQRRDDDEDMPMAASWDLSVFRYRGRDAAPAPMVASAAVPVAEPGPAEPAPEAVADPEPAPAPAAEPETAPEPVPVPVPEVVFDPAAFRNAMQRATDPMPDYDPGHLRSLMAGLANDAPAPAPPARPEAPYVPPPAPVAPEPAPAPVDGPGFDPARFRDLMTGVAHDAPAPAAPAVPEPVYVPPPAQPSVPAPEPLDAHQLVADWFRAAMNTAANDAPAPPTPPEAEPEQPDPIPAIDRTLFERSLREARL